MPPDRCPTCDRVVATIGSPINSDRYCFASMSRLGAETCAAHAVDWRKRAMEAEARGFAAGVEAAARVCRSRFDICAQEPVTEYDRFAMRAYSNAEDCIRALATKRSNDDGK